MPIRQAFLPAMIAIGLAVGPITLRASDWRDYARATMTPDFEWAESPVIDVPTAHPAG
jgi:hypothetical protein